MNIEVKELEPCKLNVNYEADAQDVARTRDEVVFRFSQEQIPGFRKGKAPLDAIKMHFKSHIKNAVKEELAQAAYSNVLADKQITPFGQPSFTSIQLDGNTFKCSFILFKIPDVTLGQYKGFSIPKPPLPDLTEMSEKTLQELRVRNGDTLPFTEHDIVERGNTIIVNLTATSPTQDVPVLKKDGEMFVVGEAKITELNDNVLGMHLGEIREFPGQMPDFAEEFAGLNVQFKVELVMASKVVPAALDDQLAQRVGLKDVQELITSAHGMTSSRLQDLERKHLFDQIGKQLIASHNLDIPTWLASTEAKLLAKQYGNEWDDLSDDHRSNFLGFAIKNVKLSILLNKIRQEEPDAQLGDEEVFNFIKSNVGSYKHMLAGMADKSDNEALETIINSGYMPALVTAVRDEFTLNFLVKNSEIVE